MPQKKKPYTTYPIGPLSYNRMVQALNEALKEHRLLIRGERWHSLYPSGELMYVDDFSDALLKLHQDATAGAGGGGISRDTVYAVTNGACLRIQCGTGGVNQGYSAAIDFGVLPSIKMKFGIELDFLMESTIRNYLGIVMSHYDGVTVHTAQLEYNPGIKTWRILTSGYIWENALVYEPYQRALPTFKPWHHLKYKVDFINDTYLGDLIIDGNTVNINGKSVYTYANVAAPKTLKFNIRWISSFDNIDRSVWIDNLIITKAEEA